jgi:xanthine dehydrogenase YagS FAD-binding subunit
MAVAMAALDALVHIESPRGGRTIRLDELHRLPGAHPERDTVLERGDLITAIELPPPIAARSVYVKVRERASFSFAVVSLAALLHVEDGVIRDVRLVLGGVAHRPWRATVAEGLLRGRPPDEERFTRAASAELHLAEPLRDNAYKLPLVRNLIVSTLLELQDTT